MGGDDVERTFWPTILTSNVPGSNLETIGAARLFEMTAGFRRRVGIELHTDAFEAGANVLIVDDLLATGGTAMATVQLVEKLGGKVVGTAFVVELGFLDGRSKLGDTRVESIVNY